MPKIMATLMANRDIGEHAKQPVGHQHEHDDQDRADIGRKLALLDRVLTEARTDGAFLDDCQRRPQRRRRATGSRDHWRTAR
jgi:hypothetical protein